MRGHSEKYSEFQEARTLCIVLNIERLPKSYSKLLQQKNFFLFNLRYVPPKFADLHIGVVSNHDKRVNTVII